MYGRIFWISLLWLNFALVSAEIVENTLTPSLKPLIVGGVPATMDNTRHQVSIRLKDEEEIAFGKGHFCGGSLISKKLVVSAAHCFYNETLQAFYNPKLYVVVMGTLNRYKLTVNTLFFEIKRVVHPGFQMRQGRVIHDLCLVFLDGTVPKENPAVDTIAIARSMTPPGTMCQATGWGYTDLKKKTAPAELMTVDVPIVDRRTCMKNYRYSIRMGMICAGYMEGGKDSCSGDSGGPLVHDGILVGVTSFGRGCAEPGYPGVYTDVYYYHKWIKRNNGKAKIRTFSGTLLFVFVVVFRGFEI